MPQARESLLTALRYFPQPEPSRFLSHHPGCWVVMRPDDPTLTRFQPRLSRWLDPQEMDECQAKQWGVHFTAQLHGASLAPRDLLCVRTLVVDIHPESDRLKHGAAVIERQKEHHLRHTLGAFALRPHWLIETQGGLQALYRIQPARNSKAIADALGVQRRLGETLGGQPFPGDLALVRLPGTLQFGNAGNDFFCRLLEHRSDSIPPYSLDEVRHALQSWDAGRLSAPSR